MFLQPILFKKKTAKTAKPMTIGLEPMPIGVSIVIFFFENLLPKERPDV